MNAIFSVGDTVSYKGEYMGTPLECTVIKVMPEERDVRSYRIRGGLEKFDRSVPESALTRIELSVQDRVFKE